MPEWKKKAFRTKKKAEVKAGKAVFGAAMKSTRMVQRLSKPFRIDKDYHYPEHDEEDDMKALYETGRRMAREGHPWVEAPPLQESREQPGAE